MFEPQNRYVTCGIQNELPSELQMLLWLAIDNTRILPEDKLDYLQVFTFQKANSETLSIRHEQEQPPRVCVYLTGYKEEYSPVLTQKVYVIDDGDHSTMLFAHEY